MEIRIICIYTWKDVVLQDNKIIKMERWRNKIILYNFWFFLFFEIYLLATVRIARALVHMFTSVAWEDEAGVWWSRGRWDGEVRAVAPHYSLLRLQPQSHQFASVLKFTSAYQNMFLVDTFITVTVIKWSFGHFSKESVSEFVIIFHWWN